MRRIFTAFAVGASPIGIARQLYAKGLTGPQGQAWRDTTIRGLAQRGPDRIRSIRDPQAG